MAETERCNKQLSDYEATNRTKLTLCEYDKINKQIAESNKTEAIQSFDDSQTSSINPEYIIKDICPDHHYDFHILGWNTKNTNIIQSFGMQHNDIPIHSELLKHTTDIYIDDNSTEKKIEEENMNKLRTANAKFVSKFISYIISNQCPRNDPSFFEIMTYFECIQQCIQQWVMQMLYKTDLKHEATECNKQFIIFQYVPHDDKTDMHPFELQDELGKLLSIEDKETTEILHDLQEKDYISSVPDKMKQLRKLLNKLQNIVVNENNNISTRSPLFVHHFYPNFVPFSMLIFEILTDNVNNFEIPRDVISIIVEFAITIDNSMYYDCWYLQHNAQKCDNILVELWDNLLFNKEHYKLTENNKYNGTMSNIWIPSQYLLENKNNCLQNIVNEIRNNNILHIYRQITWSLFLQIHSLNHLYNHDIKHIGGIDEDWLSQYNQKYFYQNIGWIEWDPYTVGDESYDAMYELMMYVFGGNVFNSIYGLQRMLLVHQYDIQAALIQDDVFKKKLDKRMKKVFPVIIPSIYKLIDALLKATGDAPLIFEYFGEVTAFDPLLKCYLIELMLLDGMDALVLTFAAFITLTSTELLQLYTMFNADDCDEEILKEMTKKLYAFKDVKSMSKLYIKYRKEVMEKCGDKIQLKNNPLIFPVDYRENPVNSMEYEKDISDSDSDSN